MQKQSRRRGDRIFTTFILFRDSSLLLIALPLLLPPTGANLFRLKSPVVFLMPFGKKRTQKDSIIWAGEGKYHVGIGLWCTQRNKAASKRIPAPEITEQSAALELLLVSGANSPCEDASQFSNWLCDNSYPNCSGDYRKSGFRGMVLFGTNTGSHCPRSTSPSTARVAAANWKWWWCHHQLHPNSTAGVVMAPLLHRWQSTTVAQLFREEDPVVTHASPSMQCRHRNWDVKLTALFDSFPWTLTSPNCQRFGTFCS